MASLTEILFYVVLLLAIAVVAWIGQWGRTRKVARYFVLGLTGLLGLGLLGAGGLILGISIAMPQLQLGISMQAVAWMLIGMGFTAIPALLPVTRKAIAKFVFRGLEPDAPVHVWALFIYLAAFVLTLFSLTVLYNGDIIVQSLKNTPLIGASAINAVGFLIFSFLAAGVWVCQPLRETAATLGLHRISWKTVLKMLGVAIVLAAVIQGVETLITPWVSASDRHTLQKVIEAMKLHGPLLTSLITAFAVAAFAGIGEEILFRGLIQPVFGIVPTALLFTLIHTHYGFTVYLLELFLVGLVLGWVRKRYNTTASILVHSGFDFFVLLVSLIHLQ